MDMRRLAALAALGSAALLLGALGFQYLGGLPPCKLCIWQRWPHGIAIAVGLVMLALPFRPLALLGAAAAAATSAFGVYHFGVEQAWWEGPNTCTSSTDVGGMSAGQLLDQILAAPVVRCDDVLWSFLGLSMAGWNAIISAGLVVVWLAAWRAGSR